MHIPRLILPLAPIIGLVVLTPAASAQAGQSCPSTLNPPPPSFETCQTVGGGTIASGSRVVSDPLADTGITCGSGATAFDIYNQDTFDQHATRWYDQNGNLTRRHIYGHFTFGQLSSPLADTIVPYTQTMIEDDEYAIPGDMSSGTATFTGEMLAHPGTGAPVLWANGRQLTSNVDGGLIQSSGRNDLVLYFNENDPAAVDSICAALVG
jgi:hypothetical protein